MISILDYPFVPSPHFSSRKGHGVLGTVIHYTAGGSASGTVSWFLNPTSKVSSHFVGDRDGSFTQTVPLDKAAWHAGISEMIVNGAMLSMANDFTIGIELANRGYLHKVGTGFFYELAGSVRRYHGPKPIEAALVYDNGVEITGWWEPYADEQIEGLQALLLKLKTSGYGDAAQRLVGHEEIAMPFATRKRDPGPLFPWKNFNRTTDPRTEGRLAA